MEPTTPGHKPLSEEYKDALELVLEKDRPDLLEKLINSLSDLLMPKLGKPAEK